MLDPVWLVLAVWAVLIVTAVAGGAFISLVSGGQRGRLHVLKSAFSCFKLFKNPKFIAVLVLALVGLGFVVMSREVNVIPVTQLAYYRYRLHEQPVFKVEDKGVEYVIYQLEEYPIYQTTIHLDAYFQPALFFAGAAFILAALILTAYWLAKANDRLYAAR